tara:strand:+ start:74 stop:472 length:399 start_codon:yes stop_codon:yes gene_type:complete
MFGLFKKKLEAKDIIISNIGFHNVFNYCRESFDHRLHDNYSDTIYKRIIKNLYEVLKNGSNDDELYETVINGFDFSFSATHQFVEAAQKIAKSTNKLKGQKFEETKKVIIESKFSLTNIEETIRMGKENSTW